MRAEELTPDDALENADSEPVRIHSVRRLRRDVGVPVYDLTVEGHHCYYVGKTRVLAHNS